MTPTGGEVDFFLDSPFRLQKLMLVAPPSRTMDLLTAWIHRLWTCLCLFFNQRQLKIAIVGLQNSGKTTLAALLTGHPFRADTIPTLGIDVRHATIGQTLLQVYDLAGQARHRFLWDRCLDTTDLVVYVLDLSDDTAWEAAKHALQSVLVATNARRTPVLIIGNKADLVAPPPILPPDDASPAPPGPSQQSHRSASVSSNARPFDISPYHWRFMTPLLSHYDYDDIPTYVIDTSNHHLLLDLQVLSRELGLDLRNGILHLTNETVLAMDRDIGLFTVSCRDGTGISDVIEWLMQL
ncbi:AEL232Cp [Eremothecium gossypii ATCC 10895]|uniref:AEL232Cp n=1 Tax=Eremothecium gossypii (strain ATCC 10895 / CBS 109.51 / FGSC 9923 / NRRL Y-1056) TaxID=284811 RepID=Q758J4_EREGS|nr:AEL232Cp [Eremothecium gossypii ATCC 10895]AAS52453.2 AEL232Cp [Eremothecium gossypii ATCC 10895]AEY96752.1 FAEL232Cp [Eremothecium gossypii FDAG1]